MNVRSIPVPDRMRHLPTDRRGYPIFFGALVGDDGVPFFTINDERKRARMISEDLCSICGKPLFRGRWFCGGPGSAFHDAGCYIDMPMHDECVHYALAVCPYLASPRYVREVAVRQAERARAETQQIITLDPTMIPDRPLVFVALMTTGQKLLDGNMLQTYVKPARPYRKVEYWQHGRRLDDAAGHALARLAMQELA